MDASRMLNFIITQELKVERILKYQYRLEVELQNQNETVEEK
jgi:hypothetical protein